MQAIAIAAIPAALVLYTATVQDITVVLTGAKFLQACSDTEPERIGFCHGYVQAVLDGIGSHGVKFVSLQVLPQRRSPTSWRDV